VLRDSRSSFATTSLALCFLQASQRSFELRALRASAALDLGELADELPGTAVEPSLHRLPLRLEPQAALALLIGRDAMVGDEPASVWGHFGGFLHI
jgi:hypothetical protein